MSSKEQKLAILKSMMGNREDDSLLNQDSAQNMREEENSDLPFSDAELGSFLDKIQTSNVVKLPLLKSRPVVGGRVLFTPMAAGTEEEKDNVTRNQKISLGSLGNATIELTFATDPFDKVTLFTLQFKLDSAISEDIQIACFPRNSDSPLMICKLPKGDVSAQVSKRFDPEQSEVLKDLDWDFGLVNE